MPGVAYSILYQPVWQRINFELGDDRYVSQLVGSSIQIQRNVQPDTGAGAHVGSLNMNTRTVTLTTWPAGISPQLVSFNGTAASPVGGNGSLFQADSIMFRTAAAPVAPEGFTILGTFSDGTTFNETADEDGYINDGGVLGVVNYQTGVVELWFGDPTADPVGGNVVDLSDAGIPGVTNVELRQVRADTLRYNAVTYSYIPLDADILGLDPVRLPADGRVPIFRPGSVAVVHHTVTGAPQTVTNGQTVNLGRTRLARVRILDEAGNLITAGYTVNLDAGTVTFTSVGAYDQPITIQHRIEDAALVADAQISGLLRFTRPITHDYPADESYVSSALLIGDMFARTSLIFDQGTWTNEWSDDLIGDEASGTYDDINNPPVMTNEGAITERWALRFTNTTAFQIIGEHLGVVGTGNTGSDVEPLNPSTMTPYFSLPAAGFGSGWSAGNVIRLNTVGARSPVWAARVVQQGEATETDDSFSILVRGDVDTP